MTKLIELVLKSSSSVRLNIMSNPTETVAVKDELKTPAKVKSSAFRSPLEMITGNSQPVPPSSATSSKQWSDIVDQEMADVNGADDPLGTQGLDIPVDLVEPMELDKPTPPAFRIPKRTKADLVTSEAEFSSGLPGQDASTEAVPQTNSKAKHREDSQGSRRKQPYIGSGATKHRSRPSQPSPSRPSSHHHSPGRKHAVNAVDWCSYATGNNQKHTCSGHYRAPHIKCLEDLCWMTHQCNGHSKYSRKAAADQVLSTRKRVFQLILRRQNPLGFGQKQGIQYQLLQDTPGLTVQEADQLILGANRTYPKVQPVGNSQHTPPPPEPPKNEVKKLLWDQARPVKK